MADAVTSPQFSTFKDAFCAYYRCRPEAFERKAFWKCLYRHAVLLAIPIWLFNRRFFHRDLEVIRQFGACRSADEFTVLASEFSTTNRVERNIRRGTLRIRVSGTRMVALHNRLSRYVKPHEVEKISVYPKAAPRETTPTRDGEVPVVRAEVSAVLIRRLKEAHDAVTSGQPLPEVFERVDLTEQQLIDALGQNATNTPAFAWLKGYLESQRRLRQLEAENSQLSRTVASLTIELQNQRTARVGADRSATGVG